jgi:sterol 24-C-methyltransferase
MPAPKLRELHKQSLDFDQVQKTVDEYTAYFDEKAGGTVDTRRKGYTTMVNHFYDLVTDFYEYGWGQSFHFAPRYQGEEFHASIARHQHYLALKLGLARGMKTLDVGCGVGGPMRSIARFSGATVVGINNNAYQIDRGTEHNRTAGLARLCSFVKGDFMKMPEKSESYDAAYAVEATVHAPDKSGVFGEVFRVLKPGSLFAGYDWCMTDAYDPQNPEHVTIRKEIEAGNGIPELPTFQPVNDALTKVGFQILETQDVALNADPATPWYQPLAGRGYSLQELRQKPLGRKLTNLAVGMLERLNVAPKGSQDVSAFLMRAADALVQGGELGIFTPMYFFLARKPA